MKSGDDHLKIATDTGESNKWGSALIYADILQTPLYGRNDMLNKYRLTTPLRESKTDDIRRYIKDPTRGDAGCFAVPKQVFSAFDGNVKKAWGHGEMKFPNKDRICLSFEKKE